MSEMKDMMPSSPEFSTQWGSLAKGAGIGYLVGSQARHVAQQQEALNDPYYASMNYGMTSGQYLWLKIKTLAIWGFILGFVYWFFFV